MNDQGTTPKSGLILLCLALIAIGIHRCLLGLAAMKTGELIHDLSPTHAYQWFEALFGGIFTIIAGVGGIWLVLRKPK